MNASRNTAVIVGVLYVIGTVAGVLSMIIAAPVLYAPDYLTQISTNANAVTMGALLVLTMGLALAMVPVVMFPILKKQNETLALGYVIFRGALETFTYIVGVLSWLLLVPVSQAYAQAGASGVSGSQALGTLLLDAGQIATDIGAVVFPMSALMFYYLLYRSNLVPRWLSAWGLITAIPYLASGVLAIAGLIEPLSATETLLMAPLGVQEMVLAGWLIVKGFNPSAVAPGPVDRVYGASPA